MPRRDDISLVIRTHVSRVAPAWDISGDLPTKLQLRGCQNSLLKSLPPLMKQLCFISFFLRTQLRVSGVSVNLKDFSIPTEMESV